VNGLTGSDKNGIHSEDKTSYIRSFQILGKGDQKTGFFGPDWDIDLYDNWKKEDIKGSLGDKESLWEFTESPTDPNESVIH